MDYKPSNKIHARPLGICVRRCDQCRQFKHIILVECSYCFRMIDFDLKDCQCQQLLFNEKNVNRFSCSICHSMLTLDDYIICANRTCQTDLSIKINKQEIFYIPNEKFPISPNIAVISYPTEFHRTVAIQVDTLRKRSSSENNCQDLLNDELSSNSSFSDANLLYGDFQKHKTVGFNSNQPNKQNLESDDTSQTSNSIEKISNRNSDTMNLPKPPRCRPIVYFEKEYDRISKSIILQRSRSCQTQISCLKNINKAMKYDDILNVTIIRTTDSRKFERQLQVNTIQSCFDDSGQIQIDLKDPHKNHAIENLLNKNKILETIIHRDGQRWSEFIDQLANEKTDLSFTEKAQKLIEIIEYLHEKQKLNDLTTGQLQRKIRYAMSQLKQYDEESHLQKHLNPPRSACDCDGRMDMIVTVRQVDKTGIVSTSNQSQKSQIDRLFQRDHVEKNVKQASRQTKDESQTKTVPSGIEFVDRSTRIKTCVSSSISERKMFPNESSLIFKQKTNKTFSSLNSFQNNVFTSTPILMKSDTNRIDSSKTPQDSFSSTNEINQEQNDEWKNSKSCEDFHCITYEKFENDNQPLNQWLNSLLSKLSDSDEENLEQKNISREQIMLMSQFKEIAPSYFQAKLTDFQQQNSQPIIVPGDLNLSFVDLDNISEKLYSTIYFNKENEFTSLVLFDPLTHQIHTDTSILEADHFKISLKIIFYNETKQNQTTLLIPKHPTNENIDIFRAESNAFEISSTSTVSFVVDRNQDDSLEETDQSNIEVTSNEQANEIHNFPLSIPFEANTLELDALFIQLNNEKLSIKLILCPFEAGIDEYVIYDKLPIVLHYFSNSHETLQKHDHILSLLPIQTYEHEKVRILCSAIASPIDVQVNDDDDTYFVDSPVISNMSTDQSNLFDDVTHKLRSASSKDTENMNPLWSSTLNYSNVKTEDISNSDSLKITSPTSNKEIVNDIQISTPSESNHPLFVRNSIEMRSDISSSTNINSNEEYEKREELKPWLTTSKSKLLPRRSSIKQISTTVEPIKLKSILSMTDASESSSNTLVTDNYLSTNSATYDREQLVPLKKLKKISYSNNEAMKKLRSNSKKHRSILSAKSYHDNLKTNENHHNTYTEDSSQLPNIDQKCGENNMKKCSNDPSNMHRSVIRLPVTQIEKFQCGTIGPRFNPKTAAQRLLFLPSIKNSDMSPEFYETAQSYTDRFYSLMSPENNADKLAFESILNWQQNQSTKPNGSKFQCVQLLKDPSKQKSVRGRQYPIVKDEIDMIDDPNSCAIVNEWAFADLVKFERKKFFEQPLINIVKMKNNRKKIKKNSNTNQSIKICLRKRPLAEVERNILKEVDIVSVVNKEDIYLHIPSITVDNQVFIKNHRYKFDEIFDENCQTNTIYHSTLSPLLDMTLEGHKCLCLIGGGKYSGKTYLLRSLIDLLSYDLIHLVSTHNIYVKFIGICHNRIVDILQNYSPIRFMKSVNSNLIPNDEFHIENTNDMNYVLCQIKKRRRFIHQLIEINIYDKNQSIYIGSLMIVILASSQNIHTKSLCSDRNKFLINSLNKTILSFERALIGIRQNPDRIRTAFNNDILTKLIQPYVFSEHSNVCFIGTLNPGHRHRIATKSTVEFARNLRFCLKRIYKQRQKRDNNSRKSYQYFQEHEDLL